MGKKKEGEGRQALESCAAEAASFLKGFGHPQRLLLLCSLLEEEKCVTDLAGELGLSQPLISQHLKVLRDEGIVAARRDAQKIFYALRDETALRIMEALASRFRSSS